MKRHWFYTEGIIFFLFAIKLSAQPQMDSIHSTIEPHRLQISYYKTSCLMFSYPVITVDRGSREVIAQIAKKADTLLFVKANKLNFKETNLSVITADGRFYSFILNYAENPAELTHIFKKLVVTPQLEKVFVEVKTNEEGFRRYSSLISEYKRSMHGVSENKYEMKFRLKGLYIHEDGMYCQLEIQNHSNIKYDIDHIRFYIRDKKTSRRTANQEMEVRPLFVFGNYKTIDLQSNADCVMAIPELTLPDQKYLFIELIEKNGGRHFLLKVSNAKILNAKLLPE